MLPPPRTLDGYEVLRWVARQHPFYSIEEDGSARGVVAMAICRYTKEQGPRVYLFKCDAEWDVIADWDYDSVEEAMVAAAANGVHEDEWSHFL